MGAGAEFSPSVFPTDVDVSSSAFISGTGFSGGFVPTAPSSLCFMQMIQKERKKNIHIILVPGWYYAQLNVHSCHAEQTSDVTAWASNFNESLPQNFPSWNIFNAWDKLFHRQ